VNNELWLGSEGGGGGPTPPPSGYNIERSVRFNSADSAYLSRTPASAGNRKTWTWAGWVKRSTLGSFQTLFGGGPTLNDTHYAQFGFNTANNFVILAYSFYWRITTQVFRDPSAWFHVVVAFDTTQATAGNRIKLYINGSQVTVFSTTSDPSLNQDLGININAEHRIGNHAASSPSYCFDGYLADVHFIDGQALDPTSFGEFDSNGVWQPKEYTGSYGLNVNQSQVWSNGSNGSRIDFPITNAFDGSFTSIAYAAASSTYTITLPGGSIPLTSLRVYALKAGTATAKFYVNGVDYTTQIASGTNWNTITGESQITSIAIAADAGTNYVGLYAVEVNGQILVDTGVTLTNNGFHLDFSDNSTAAALGTDTSGNSNTWTVNNISVASGAGNDSLVDSPTNYGTDTGVGGEVRGNYCTLNPLITVTGTLSNGDLDFSSGAQYRSAFSTFAVTTGKWYIEGTVTNLVADALIGIASGSLPTGSYLGSTSTSWSYAGTYGSKWNSNNYTAYGSTFTTNDVIGVAFDADTGKLWFSKNGVWQSSGDPASGTNPAFTVAIGASYFFGVSGGSAGSWSCNFGQRPFAYSAPSGFKALNTANLSNTTITTSGTYTGNGVTDGPFVYLNGVPTAMTIGGNSVTFGTTADKLSNGFKIRTNSTTYNQNASTYNYTITSTGDPFKTARAQSNP